VSADEKPIAWIGSARRELLEFPDGAKRQVGYNLGLVQNGLMPEDYTPMEQVGPGTYEIRVQTHEGGRVIHRVFYVAKFDEAVYVLHAFQKNSQATSKHDIEIGRERYRAMLDQRREPSRGGDSKWR
jgi:phage-related protein